MAKLPRAQKIHRRPTGARPGQGRARAGVWPMAKLPRAQKMQRRRPAPGPVRAAPAQAFGQWPNCRERKKTRNFCWNWIFLVAIPRARKSTTFAGIACSPRSRRATARLARAQKNTRKRFTGVRLDARPGQGRARAGVWPMAKLPRAQKMQRRRPAPGPVRAAPAQAFGQWPNCRERNRCSGVIMRRHYNVRGHYNVRVCHP